MEQWECEWRAVYSDHLQQVGGLGQCSHGERLHHSRFHRQRQHCVRISSSTAQGNIELEGMHVGYNWVLSLYAEPEEVRHPRVFNTHIPNFDLRNVCLKRFLWHTDVVPPLMQSMTLLYQSKVLLLYWLQVTSWEDLVVEQFALFYLLHPKIGELTFWIVSCNKFKQFSTRYCSPGYWV